jgi:outer membrane lipoprotein carrier protein
MHENLRIRSCAALLAVLVLAGCGGRESAAAPAGREAAPPPAAPAPAGEIAAGAEGDAGVAGSDAPPASDPPGGVDSRGGGTAAPPAAPAAGAAQDRAAEILSRAERASREIRSLEADFTQSLTIPLLNQSQRSAGRLFQRRPDRFLMRFSDPAGDVIVADGRHFWLYYPSSDARQVIRTSIAAGGEAVDLQQQFLSNPNQRFVATLIGEESVGGRPAHVLTLVPRGPSPYRLLRIWVDREDHLVRRFEMTEENDSVRRVELRNLRTNHPLPDALFAFTPPEGAQVFDQ